MTTLENSVAVDNRTIEDIDGEIGKVRDAVERLSAERQRLSDELSLGDEPEALVKAALSGKSIATSAKTRKQQDRLSEIDAQLAALENHGTRLQLERVDSLMADAENEYYEKGEAVQAASEKARAAADELAQARNQVAWTRESLYSLRERRGHLQNRLLESDAAFRSEQEQEAQRRREEAQPTAEEVERYRRQFLSQVAGIALLESPEDEAAYRRAAAQQGASVTILGHKDRGNES